ncbi:unnamed protein product [Vitrella brassicaformis CCMP3155]|uniref:Uncharacterized protein n=1 Tax=Vitrella brassicaformis (strain CCMP3155) TaxID=1169540 RepID=A0A0G4GIZ1_VITBC|nr:unnamed protein product [Vitrella brassicaformis CCMP3155]|eukprot:CEM29807.1 unnamed protein product [Vitrella brassicaformis CCMP3155]
MALAARFRPLMAFPTHIAYPRWPFWPSQPPANPPLRRGSVIPADLSVEDSLLSSVSTLAWPRWTPSPRQTALVFTNPDAGRPPASSLQRPERLTRWPMRRPPHHVPHQPSQQPTPSPEHNDFRATFPVFQRSQDIPTGDRLLELREDNRLETMQRILDLKDPHQQLRQPLTEQVDYSDLCEIYMTIHPVPWPSPLPTHA